MGGVLNMLEAYHREGVVMISDNRKLAQEYQLRLQQIVDEQNRRPER
jgi:hypothetical protein